MRPDIEQRIRTQRNTPTVNLEGLSLQDEELSEILTHLKILKPSMVCIDLDNNDISDEGAKILSERLRDFAQIREISVQYNRIGKPGAIRLFALLKDFPGLNILFRGNGIVDDAKMYAIEHEASTTR